MAVTLATAPARLQAVSISKAFGATRALSDVTIEFVGGEIHAVVGENGAGKSTLMQILAGVIRPDAGHLVMNGQRVVFRSRQEAARRGVGIVFQELSLAPTLSVEENIVPVNPPTRWGLIDRRRRRRLVAELLQRIGLDVDPGSLVGSLPLSQQQLVEIAKAMASHPRFLILDEPTSSLTPQETERLFALIDALADEGLGVIYISHRLDEVFRVARQVSVLRNGEHVGTFARKELDERRLVGLMLGKSLAQEYGESLRPTTTEPMVTVRNLVADRVNDVSLTVGRGEIVGIVGLAGAGRTELMEAIFGLRPRQRGEVVLNVDGRALRPQRPRDFIAAGCFLVPEDRKREGLFLSMALRDNPLAPNLPRWHRGWFVDEPRTTQVSQALMDRLRIKAVSVWQRVDGLSGGNQQKVLFAMAASLDPRLLLIDEPTRGVDVGSKLEIHSTLRDMAAKGTAVLFVSSDLPEALSLGHRLYVMYKGRLVAELTPPYDREQVLAYAAGVRI